MTTIFTDIDGTFIDKNGCIIGTYNESTALLFSG